MAVFLVKVYQPEAFLVVELVDVLVVALVSVVTSLVVVSLLLVVVTNVLVPQLNHCNRC